MNIPDRLAQVLAPAALAVFAGVTLVFIVLSIVLNYHWTRYGVAGSPLRNARLAYFGISGALLLSLAGLLVALFT